MTGYLGEFPVVWKDTPFSAFTAVDWALYFVRAYGGIDGEHHKQWLIDQVVRILKGGMISVVEARWVNGESEYRITVGASDAYIAWVKDQKCGEDGPETYAWDKGIAP